jgi:uncharacterized protein (DUF302 family)
MENHFKKSVVRMSFEAVLGQLKDELSKEGFQMDGETDFQQTARKEYHREMTKYKVLTVHDPFLYNEMMRISPYDGIILPCLVSVIETNPGETAVVPYNPTEMIVREIQNPSLQNLAGEVTRRLALAIKALGHDQTVNPDLVTSWS